MKYYYLSFIAFLLLPLLSNAQNALKRSKQTTDFHYLQANLHYGYFNPPNADNYLFDVPPAGPRNRIAYQFLSKNQRLLQKGYVRHTNLNQFRFRISFDFNGTLRDDDDRINLYQLRLQNVGASFRTKWDRTRFFVGYSNIKFGNNPKIDPVTDFTANSTSRDIGFSQDFGVTYRTPLSAKLDFEVGLYTGGVFSRPLLTYQANQLVEDGDKLTEEDKWTWMDIRYDNNWLTTFRVGTPLFRSFEYGVIALAGRVQNGSTNTTLGRVGFDMVKKFGERLKLSNQVTSGYSNPDSGPSTFDLTLQNQVEGYLRGLFILNASHAMVLRSPLEEEDGSREDDRVGGQITASISYVVSPHTRIRLNHFYNYRNSRPNDLGFTCQLVTGIGRR